MKRIWLALTVTALAVGCGGSAAPGTGSGAPAPTVAAASSADDVQKLQGTWAAVEVLHDGQVQKLGSITWTFTPDRYTNQVGKQSESWAYALDAAKTPKRISSQHYFGPTPGRKLTGIYELSGATLKVCYDLTGEGYPNDFTAAKGARRIFYTFKRE